MRIYDFNCITKIYKDEELEQKHTKQLLNKLRAVRLSQCETYSCKHWEECEKNREYNISLLKEFLSHREHIPNKQESKAIRKAKIKKGK